MSRSTSMVEASFKIESVSPRDGVASIDVKAVQVEKTVDDIAGAALSFTLPADTNLDIEPGDMFHLTGFVEKVGENGLKVGLENVERTTVAEA